MADKSHCDGIFPGESALQCFAESVGMGGYQLAILRTRRGLPQHSLTKLGHYFKFLSIVLVGSPIAKVVKSDLAGATGMSVIAKFSALSESKI